MRIRLATMLAVFLAAFLAAEASVRLVTDDLPEPVTWYHEIAQAKVEQMSGLDEDLDYLFIGTSQSYHGIDPAVIDERLGTHSYNAAIPAGIPPLQRRWLDDAVLPGPDVETVVWSMSSMDLNAARPQEMGPIYDEAFQTRDGVLAAADRWLSERLELFRQRRTLTDPRSWLDHDDPLDAARSVLHASGKRRPGRPDTGDAERRRVRRDLIGDFEVGGRMSDDIRATVDALRARGIDVVFVWLPQAPRFVDLLPDPALEAEARREAQRLASDLGLPLIDVSGGFGDGDFIDFTHLGGDAARRLSHTLAYELAQWRGRR